MTLFWVGVERCELPVASYQYPVSSFQLPVSSFQSPVSSFQFPVLFLLLGTGNWELETGDWRLEAGPYCAGFLALVFSFDAVAVVVGEGELLAMVVDADVVF